MNRVHGEHKIIRTQNILLQNDYQKYRNQLSSDFQHICGYCGKPEFITTRGFEIDHFIPKSLAPEREKDYGNLVYACLTCNRKKTKKWPTQNKNLSNDGTVGFVDPASTEYDEHLYRDVVGRIMPHTKIGQYMCEDVFKFHVRPMSTIWKIVQLKKAKEVLRQHRRILSQEDMFLYMEIDELMESLETVLFHEE